MPKETERDSLRVITSSHRLDSDLHAVLLRLAYPPSWKCDETIGKEVYPVPQRFEEREQIFEKATRSGAFFGVGALSAFLISKFGLSNSCDGNARSECVSTLGPVSKLKVPSFATFGVLAGARFVELYPEESASTGLTSFMSALGLLDNVFTSAAAAATISSSAQAMGSATGSIVAGAGGALAATAISAYVGAKVGRFAAKKYLDATGDSEKEELAFFELVEKHRLDQFFNKEYLTTEVWNLPSADEDEWDQKLWFDVATLSRISSKSEVLMYVGTFKGGKLHGQGMVSVSSGRPVFFGEFNDGLPHGKGVLLRDFKAIAELEFKRGNVHKYVPIREVELTKYEFIPTGHATELEAKRSWTCCLCSLPHIQRPNPSALHSAQKIFGQGGNLKGTGAFAAAKEMKDRKLIYVSFCPEDGKQPAREVISKLIGTHGSRLSFRSGSGSKGVDTLTNLMGLYDIALVILTSSYLQSLTCLLELVVAQRLNKVLIPVVVSEGGFQFKDFEQGIAQYERVVRSIDQWSWGRMIDQNVLPIDIMSATDFLLRREKISTLVRFTQNFTDEECSFDNDMEKLSKILHAHVDESAL